MSSPPENLGTGSVQSGQAPREEQRLQHHPGGNIAQVQERREVSLLYGRWRGSVSALLYITIVAQTSNEEDSSFLSHKCRNMLKVSTK